MSPNQTKTSELTDYEKLIQARNTARKEIIKKTKEPEISWLTENSRKFLESGYLTGKTTPEERIREIADNAEGILKIKGFSDKFY
jgi:ribonucleoside-diphosphate reductase alpha chain